MSMPLGQTRQVGRALIVAGAAIAIVCSAFGFLRAFMMSGPAITMPGMAGPGGGKTLHGMALSDMPEMFAAGAGILLAFTGAVLVGSVARPARKPIAAGTGFRGRGVIALVATGALTIDVSKTSTLGFVIPGMRSEYGIDASRASLLAVGGLSGTAVGALLFTRLADRIGRRASYLIATLGFTATSMCGGMPAFTGNVVTCFLMGIAVGGLAPLLITILSDLFPGKTRGPVVTGLSVIATAIGYLVASGSALWLEPTYGWRVLWLIGAPTGLVLAAATILVPERAPLAGTSSDEPSGERRQVDRTTLTVRLQRVYAVAIGLLTFGLTTWVPTLSRAGGLSLTTANTLLTSVAVAMVPCAALMTLVYRRIGPVSLAVRLAVCTTVALLALAASGLTSGEAWLSAAMLTAALFAVNTMAAIFLPIAADLAESGRRGRTTGTISFFNRIGGLTGPLVVSLIVSSVTDVLVAVAVLASLCGAIAWYTGRRHRVVHAAVAREREPERA